MIPKTQRLRQRYKRWRHFVLKTFRFWWLDQIFLEYAFKGKTDIIPTFRASFVLHLLSNVSLLYAVDSVIFYIHFNCKNCSKNNKSHWELKMLVRLIWSKTLWDNNKRRPGITVNKISLLPTTELRCFKSVNFPLIEFLLRCKFYLFHESMR